jgi:23S rRNA-intervening sequence protein
VQDYRNLEVWERAHQLTLAVYKATTVFPKDELYSLTSQIRRSCSSIPANIKNAGGMVTLNLLDSCISRWAQPAS